MRMAIHLLLSWLCVIKGVSKATWCFWDPTISFSHLGLWFSWQMLKHKHNQITPQWQYTCKHCSYPSLGQELTDSESSLFSPYFFFFSCGLLWVRLIPSLIHIPKKTCRSRAQEIRKILATTTDNLLWLSGPRQQSLALKRKGRYEIRRERWNSPSHSLEWGVWGPGNITSMASQLEVAGTPET